MKTDEFHLDCTTGTEESHHLPWWKLTSYLISPANWCLLQMIHFHLKKMVPFSGELQTWRSIAPQALMVRFRHDFHDILHMSYDTFFFSTLHVKRDSTSWLIWWCIYIYTRWWFQRFFILPLLRELGKWSNFTNIFQLGWNHQLV